MIRFQRSRPYIPIPPNTPEWQKLGLKASDLPAIQKQTEKEAARLGEKHRQGGSEHNSLDYDFKSQTFFDKFLLRNGIIRRLENEIKAVLADLNTRKPGFHAHYCRSVREAMALAGREVSPDTPVRVFIGRRDHSYVMEFREHEDGKVTLLILDSLNFLPREVESHRKRAVEMEQTLKKAMLRASAESGKQFLVAILAPPGSQRDESSCPPSDKDFLKSLCNPRNEAAYLKIHRAGLNAFEGTSEQYQFDMRLGEAGTLDNAFQKCMGNSYRNDNIIFVGSPDALKILPLDVYKNLQSADLLASIHTLRPEAYHEPINTKGETLLARLQRITGMAWLLPQVDGMRARKAELTNQVRTLPMLRNYMKSYSKVAAYLEKEISGQGWERERTESVTPPKSSPRPYTPVGSETPAQFGIFPRPENPAVLKPFIPMDIPMQPDLSEPVSYPPLSRWGRMFRPMSRQGSSSGVGSRPPTRMPSRMEIHL